MLFLLCVGYVFPSHGEESCVALAPREAARGGRESKVCGGGAHPEEEHGAGVEVGMRRGELGEARIASWRLGEV